MSQNLLVSVCHQEWSENSGQTGGRRKTVFACGVTKILWNLQPEQFQLRETRTEVWKAVTWRSKSGKISTLSYNARIMGIKRACQRVTFGEATELSALQRYAFKIPQNAVGATS